MIKLVSYSKDYLENIIGAMEHCYETKCTVKSLKKSIEAGHLSLLEHSMATFDIECSLAVLGQITRHRHLSFTVKSTRGANFDEFKIPKEIEAFSDGAINLYTTTLEKSINNYQQLINKGISKESAAYLLPKATLTKMRVSGNLRAWYEYLPKRLCKRALPEHRNIAIEIQRQLIEVMPEIFESVTTNCQGCKETKCIF